MRILSVLLCLIATASVAQEDERPTLRIGTEGVYPPWNSTGDKGELQGFEIDLANDLCGRLNRRCAFVVRSLDAMMPALDDGEFDVIMTGMTITDKREELIDFSRCYAAEVAVFAVRSDNALAGTITPRGKIDLTVFSPEVKATLNALRQALAGTTIGVQVATRHGDFARQYLSDLVEIRYFDTLDSLTLDLDAGRIDAALSSKAYWWRMAKGDNPLDLTLIGPDMIGDVFGKGVGAGLRHGDRALLAELNDVIDAARADGTVARLAKHWFGYDLSC